MKGVVAVAGLGRAVSALVWSPTAFADPSTDPVTVAPAPPPAAMSHRHRVSAARWHRLTRLPPGRWDYPIGRQLPGLLLGQNAAPAAPGTPASVTAPDLRAFNGDYLLPQNVAPAAPGQV